MPTAFRSEKISGSLTNLTDGTSYLIAGGGIAITSESNGAVTIATGSGGAAGVTGPGSSTDNSIARWSGTAGQQIKNSTWHIDNSGVLSGAYAQEITRSLTTVSDPMLSLQWGNGSFTNTASIGLVVDFSAASSADQNTGPSFGIDLRGKRNDHVDTFFNFELGNAAINIDANWNEGVRLGKYIRGLDDVEIYFGTDYDADLYWNTSYPGGVGDGGFRIESTDDMVLDAQGGIISNTQAHAGSFPGGGGTAEDLPIGQYALVGVDTNSERTHLTDGTSVLSSSLKIPWGFIPQAIAGSTAAAYLASIDGTVTQVTTSLASANVGDQVWMDSANPGHVTLTRPTASGSAHWRVGYAFRTDASIPAIFLRFQEEITSYEINDNQANAFWIYQGSDSYLDVNTTNGAESIILGNSTTNPVLVLSGTGGFNITDDNNYIWMHDNVELAFGDDYDAWIEWRDDGTYLTERLDFAVPTLTFRLVDYLASNVTNGDVGVATGSITQGDIASISSGSGAGSTQFQWIRNDVTNQVTSSVQIPIGISVDTATDGQDPDIASLHGTLSAVNTNLTGEDPGTKVYADPSTPGGLTTTRPNTSGSAIWRIGYVIDAGVPGTAKIIFDPEEEANDIGINDNQADAFKVSDGTVNYINVNTTDYAETLEFGDATISPDYLFLGSGSMGVGLSSPEVTLHVSGSGGLLVEKDGALTTPEEDFITARGDADHVNIVIDAGTARQGRLVFREVGTDKWSIRARSAAGDRLSIFNSGTVEKLMLDHEGRLGVNGGEPNHSLFVFGNGVSDQVFLLSGSGAPASPDESQYNDVAFFVSGAIGSTGSNTKGVAVFGGDVVISGNLGGGSPLNVGTDAVFHADVTFNGNVTGAGLTTLIEVTDDSTYAGVATPNNYNLILSASGNGAIQAHITDSDVGGGNVRGTNAVDLQLDRDNAAEVAYGTRSGLFAGFGNRIGLNGNESVILGGQNGTIGANVTQAAIVGGINSSCNNGDRATIVGGSAAIADGSQCFIGGGFTNEIDSGGSDAAILAGRNNDVSAAQGAVIAGRSSDVTSAGGVVLGGWMGLADHPATVVFSGNTRALSDSNRGQSQGQLVHLDQRTSDATTQSLVAGGESGGVGPWSGTELSVPANTAFGITGKVVAWNESSGSMATWEVDLDCYSTDGSSVSFLGGSGPQTVTRNNMTSGTPALAISGTSNSINFDVNGVGSDTIRWSAALLIARAAT